MTDWMEVMGLKHFGFNDDQIAQIDATIPKFKYLWDLGHNNRTVIAEVFGVVGMILTQIDKFRQEQGND